MAGPQFRLESRFDPAGGAGGQLTVDLVNTGDVAVSGFSLALTAMFRVRPETPIKGGMLVEQVSNYHRFAPPEGFALAPGARWRLGLSGLSHTLDHYTYGPKSAAIWLEDGSQIAPEILPTARIGQPGGPMIAWPDRGRRPDESPPVSVIPFPADVSVSGARDAGKALGLVSGPEVAGTAFATVSALADRLFPGEGLFGEGGIAVTAELDAARPREGYRLVFGDTVHLAAGDAAGFRHGLITLAQILRGARAHPEDFVFPAQGTIEDAPRFGWRGAHLDVARQVYGVAEITRFLDTMAWNKLNRFHIHLSDDEGWRLEIPGYPQLAAEAAWRGPDEAVPPLLGSPFARHGIVYSAQEVAGFVAHGLDCGIDTVPEIDIPGHCYCVLAALPDLRDPDESGTYHSVQYFANNALNPALPQTYDFIAAVLDTLVELFPARWIHVGGDEVADDAWQGSPAARRLMEEEGLDGTFGLQSYFLKRVQAMIAARGRSTGAWEEAALGGGVDPGDSYLVAWKASQSGRDLAVKGYDVVLAPAEHCYFDMALADDWWAPGSSWAGIVSLETAYAFDPAHDWPEAAKARLMGVQSCLWGENLAERNLFDYFVYPRLSALAETAWTPREGKDLARFMAAQSLMPMSGAR